MNAPIVHIGYHKTATSWFQGSFYPKVKNAAYLERKRVREAFLNPTAFRFDAEWARTVLETDGRPILCEEDLCGHFENGGMLEALSKDVAYRIHRVFPDAQIVIFVRNQPDMIRASFLQYRRSGGTKSLKRFLFPYENERWLRGKRFKKPLLTLDHFAYQHLVAHYQAVFGAENVHVYCYEEFRADPKAFADRFRERFNLSVDLDEVDFRPRNDAFGRVSLRLARWLSPFTRWDSPERPQFLPVLPKKVTKTFLTAFNRTPLAGRSYSNRSLFGERLYRELNDRFVDDNQVLARITGLPLAQYGYPMSSMKGGSEPKESFRHPATEASDSSPPTMSK